MPEVHAEPCRSLWHGFEELGRREGLEIYCFDSKLKSSYCRIREERERELVELYGVGRGEAGMEMELGAELSFKLTMEAWKGLGEDDEVARGEREQGEREKNQRFASLALSGALFL